MTDTEPHVLSRLGQGIGWRMETKGRTGREIFESPMMAGAGNICGVLSDWWPVMFAQTWRGARVEMVKCGVGAQWIVIRC